MIDMGNCGWNHPPPPQKKRERMSYNHLQSYFTTTTNTIQIYILDRMSTYFTVLRTVRWYHIVPFEAIFGTVIINTQNMNM